MNLNISRSRDHQNGGQRWPKQASGHSFSMCSSPESWNVPIQCQRHKQGHVCQPVGHWQPTWVPGQETHQCLLPQTSSPKIQCPQKPLWAAPLLPRCAFHLPKPNNDNSVTGLGTHRTTSVTCQEPCLSTSPPRALLGPSMCLVPGPGPSVSPQGSASFHSPSTKLLPKAIIVFNKMYLLRKKT